MKGIEFARQLHGHANISTMQRSMHLDNRELAEAQFLIESLRRNLLFEPASIAV